MTAQPVVLQTTAPPREPLHKIPVGHPQERQILRDALRATLTKFDPRVQVRNPVMFIVWLGAIVCAALTIDPQLFGPSGASRWYNGAVTFILILTVWFANLAEALAEGRGKAKAEALRRTKVELVANRLIGDGKIATIPASDLRRGDVVRVQHDEVIPCDGEVIGGTAYCDESAITGESAPVLKEPGTDDFSSVTAGTVLVSDTLDIRVTADPGQTFLDRMIHLVEGASRQKTPNEIALTVLLVVLTLIFVIVVAAMAPVSAYENARINVADLVALLVALIPTTIGALLSAIGIAGIDRTMRFNLLATSGKAVEAAGDVQTLILDKTGTITTGNRQATEFIPLAGHSARDLVQAAYLSSAFDQTPEGRTIYSFAQRLGAKQESEGQLDGARFQEFSARTRMSGVDLANGRALRKGAAHAITQYVTQTYGTTVPADLEAVVDRVARKGATPLVVADGGEILGVIVLSDVVKPGIPQRIDQLRKMGIRSIMVTGDNPVTARAVGDEAGVDEVVAESRPEEKLEIVRTEQSKGRLVAMTGDGTNDAPALAQADVGVAMYTGTMAAKEAANIVDLDSDPTKLLDLVDIGKQMLITRGSLTTFSIANDVAKYFAILPAMFMGALPGLGVLNVMTLATPQTAVLSALIFNALIIPALIPLALRGVNFRPEGAEPTFYRNLMIYGVGGLILPFAGIKAIDTILAIWMGGH